ncbi:unnamed protein product [marine sediment metagenome]|uniref:Uncharacterized protein n=1 Tax=marine sediment metagenome TaxID=412755 RepID=X0URF4_9ZZZZ
MIEDKILRYEENLTLALKLTNNQYADHEYYEKMVSRLEKMLIFYENLKVWKVNSGK